MTEIEELTPALSEAAKFALEHARNQLRGKSILVLTGAGVSTDSGIPDYRGTGRVERHPMTYDVFLGSEHARIRYWSRSYVGWSVIANAVPNPGHLFLAQAEKQGRINHVVTQNVDTLHQKAGSSNVIDLHGRLDQVVCMNCKHIVSRLQVDQMIEQLNPGITKDSSVIYTPDGDAEVEATNNFKIPTCSKCDGILKPDVVFFGESVPADRVALSMNQLEQADALLVAGSSLAVNSGMRFARKAKQLGKPIVIVNIGPTRADEIALAKIEASTSIALKELLID